MGVYIYETEFVLKVANACVGATNIYTFICSAKACLGDFITAILNDNDSYLQAPKANNFAKYHEHSEVQDLVLKDGHRET